MTTRFRKLNVIPTIAILTTLAGCIQISDSSPKNANLWTCGPDVRKSTGKSCRPMTKNELREYKTGTRSIPQEKANMATESSALQNLIKDDQSGSNKSIASTTVGSDGTQDYRNTGRGGWQPLSGNPKISYDDAKSICEPRAIAEGKYFQRTGTTRGGSTYSCTQYGFNNVLCRESDGGGYASGILKGLEDAMNQRDAQKVYEATAKACMAEYGWILR